MCLTKNFFVAVDDNQDQNNMANPEVDTVPVNSVLQTEACWYVVLSTHKQSRHKRSGQTIYAVINGPAGPLVLA